jgi:lipase chaperone LimK
MAIPNKWLAAVLLLGGTAAWGWWAAGSGSDAGSSPASSVSAQNPFAASLKGTQSDGSAHLSANGELVVDESLRQLFDYYLSTLGERDLNAVRAAVAAELRRRLSGPPLKSALDLFERYLAFKQNTHADESQLRQASLADRLAAMRTLRHRYFNSQEIAGLFGTDDSYDDFTVKRLQILADTKLSAADKARRVSELENQLPEPLRKARSAPVQHIALAEEEAALRRSGGTEQDIYALRTQTVGQAAADRLATLDQEQAQWKGRIDSFKQARQQIQDNTSLDSQQKQDALDKLTQSSFTPQEQRRLAAYGIK